MLYPDRSAITIWPDVGGGVAISGQAVASIGGKALCFKISEGRGYIDPAGVMNRNEAVQHGLLPIAYTFPLPDACGMSLESQAERDVKLITRIHGSLDNIGLMTDVETQPQQGSWGPFYFGLAPTDFRRYIEALRMAGWGHRPVGVYSGGWYWRGILGNPPNPFDWTVSSGYNYSSSTAARDVWWILNTGPDGTGVTPRYIPNAWGNKSIDFRQFTDAGNVNGRPTDWNIAWVPFAQFKARILGTPAPPQPKPQEKDMLALAQSPGRGWALLDGEGKLRRIGTLDILHAYQALPHTETTLTDAQFAALPQGPNVTADPTS